MITATVLTKNSQKTLQKTLDSLKTLPEVIVLDSGSTDQTLAIAARYPNVTVHNSPFLGFGPMHNYAVKLASNDWILSIDSDEVLSQELIHELSTLSPNPKTVYKLQRHNYFNGKLIKWCGGWHPDFVIRFFNRKTTQFTNDLVHERVDDEGLSIKTLESPLLHTPYLEISDFIDKMQHYSELFTDQNEGKTASLFQALIHGWYAFFKSYILKRGFAGGKEGFVISMYNGHCTFYKYLKLAMKAR